MRTCIAFLSLGLISACAAPAVETAPPPTTGSASDAAFTSVPQPEPTPLPLLSPTSRSQRQMERMSASELAQWILPASASRVAAAELFPARWGVLTYAYLWEAPRPAGPTGVCEVTGWGVGFRVDNENNLTDQQRLDPPLRPAFTVPERRFRVVGSTRREAAGAEANCAVGQPYWGWSNAPSAEELYSAANLMEQAQALARSSRSPGFRLACRQRRSDEATGQTTDVKCEDARSLLQRLTPDLIKRVRATPCDGDFTRSSAGGCTAIEYHDPAAPGTYSLYMVRVEGRGRPLAIDVVQGMLPPQ